MEKKWWPTLEEYDPGFSKDDWKKLLQDRKLFNFGAMCIMKRFLDFGGDATCVELAEKYGRTFSSYNLASSQLAKKIIKKTNCKIPPENLFPVLFFGRGVQKEENRKGSYIWKLRDELKAALEETDLSEFPLEEPNDNWKELLKQFKTIMYTSPEIVFDDEVYKWQTITACVGLDGNEILSYLIKTNSNLLYSYSRTDSKILLDKIEFSGCIKQLIDESRTLSERLKQYKEKIASFYNDKKSIINDERSASVFLTCNNPEEYTFYKDSYYNSLCKFLKIEPETAGEKYEHYMTLIDEFVPFIEADSEIMNFYKERTALFKNSIKLIAQNIFYILFEKKKTSYIIANIAWNSSDWKGIADDKTNFRWTQEDGNIPNESWNFDFNNPRNTNGKVNGFAQFNNPPIGAEEQSFFIVFWSQDKQGNKRIAGFYGGAQISKQPKEIDTNIFVNIEGNKKLSILLENKINDDDKQFLFGKKRVSENGFNYISKHNSLTIVDEAIKINPNQIKELTLIRNWLESTIASDEDKNNIGENDMSNAENLSKLLKNTYNVILHGAPGTGKTFLARKIAEEMGCTENELGFVQFHPSYDYTDFVEGIRPNNNNSFDRKDGIFKTFCKKALQNLLDADKSVTKLQEELSWDEKVITFLDDSIEKKLKHPLKNAGNVMIENYHEDIVDIVLPDNPTHKNDVIHISKLLKILNAEQTFDKAVEIERFLDDYHSAEYSYLLAIYKSIKEYQFNPSEFIPIEIEKVEEKKFVFIIDEINRGELSKIFGELFFSVDPDYRGIDGIVDTQYQNLVPKNDVFEKGFYIPKNVYIIGTMNDIDRSVESMDLAMRRRFTFKEITAEDSSIAMLSRNNSSISDFDDSLINEIKERMNKLNEVIISEEIGLSSAYQIGAAYFLKYRMYMKEENPFECLWNYNLKPLLIEYLRGQSGIEDKIKKLKDAYNLVSKN